MLNFALHENADAIGALEGSLDALAEADSSPFSAAAWLRAWWEAFGAGTPVFAAVRDETGALRAGALFVRGGDGSLRGAANEHSPDWDVAAGGDEEARAALWRGLGADGVRGLTLPVLRAPESPAAARRGLAEAGFRTVPEAVRESPYLALPGSYDELLAGSSSNFRSQVRRRTRQIEKAGDARFVAVTGGERIDELVDALIRVEASGWKGREGTAIASEPEAVRLYRAFAHAAAEHGWLRLYALELDGEVIAADLGCAAGGIGFLVKTGFDESFGKLSPGLVLRAKVLEASIEEGLHGYDFLGGPEPYKLRWTTTVRPRVTLRAVRGRDAWVAGGVSALRRGRAAVRALRA